MWKPVHPFPAQNSAAPKTHCIGYPLGIAVVPKAASRQISRSGCVSPTGTRRTMGVRVSDCQARALLGSKSSQRGARVVVWCCLMLFDVVWWSGVWIWFLGLSAVESSGSHQVAWISAAPTAELFERMDQKQNRSKLQINSSLSYPIVPESISKSASSWSLWQDPPASFVLSHYWVVFLDVGLSSLRSTRPRTLTK